MRARQGKVIERGQDWENVMDAALGAAKDEILAEYLAKNGDINRHREHLSKQGGLYDYFKNNFGINPSQTPELYQELWAEYGATIKTASDSAEYLVRIYNDYKLPKRIELLRWVLAQIPLRDWKEQLEKTLFQKEAQLLGMMILEVGRISALKTMTSRNFPATRALAMFQDSLQKSQGKPLLPITEVFFDATTAPDPKATEHSKEIVARLTRLSDDIFKALRSGSDAGSDWRLKYVRSDASPRIEKEYFAICEELDCNPDPAFLNNFLASQGWSVRKTFR